MSATVSQHGDRFTPAGIHRAAVRSEALLYTGPPLVFLLLVIIPAWFTGPPGTGLAVTVLCILYSLLFLYSCAVPQFPRSVGAGWLLASWIVLALLAIRDLEAIGYMVIYVAVMHAIVLRGRAGILAILGIGAGAAALAIGYQNLTIGLLTAMGAATAIGIQQSIDRELVEQELDRERERNAVLAVAAERERIGRDMHDILGHSLTTITVSAQLAGRLVEADPSLAREQIAEIERISRQALADVRATAAGMQEVRAAGEIASARSVLEAAGIQARLPTALPALDPQRAELFGYVIREGVTNVVRHSRATTCTIEVTPESVTVRDDGRGIPAEHDGSGLEGLRRRVEGAGGVLTIDTGQQGTTLHASLPESLAADEHTDLEPDRSLRPARAARPARTGGTATTPGAAR